MEIIIGLGVKVVLQDAGGQLQELELVRPPSAKELDLEHGQISLNSPVGRALIGHKAGEEITVNTPAGERRYRILEVRPVERASALAAGAQVTGRRRRIRPGFRSDRMKGR